MPLYASSGSTESGDDLPILLFSEPPEAEAVDARYREMMPDEYIIEDDGSEFSCVNWEVSAVELPSSIQSRLDLLDALEAAGVDNWGGYPELEEG
jgi:hypothetical protein